MKCYLSTLLSMYMTSTVLATQLVPDMIEYRVRGVRPTEHELRLVLQNIERPKRMKAITVQRCGDDEAFQRAVRLDLGDVVLLPETAQHNSYVCAQYVQEKE